MTDCFWCGEVFESTKTVCPHCATPIKVQTKQDK